MDPFQAWALGHWITLSAAGLLALNVALALLAQKRYLIIGAIALICFWAMIIAIVMLLRDKEATIWRFAVDLMAVALFYRLAERDKSTGERHDWAALICFGYVWLVFIDGKSLVFRNEDDDFLIAMSNVIFVFKVVVNMTPSIGTILGLKPLLIANPK